MYFIVFANIFDFALIFLLWLSIVFSYDALHGVAGIYAKRIFIDELGANESSLLNCTPKVFFISL